MEYYPGFETMAKKSKKQKKVVDNHISTPVKIYTVIPYFSNGIEINQNDVKSFSDYKKAEEYTWTLQYCFDVVENFLN